MRLRRTPWELYLFLVFLAEGVWSQCSKQDYQYCVKLADPLLRDPHLIYPDNARDVEHVCRTWTFFVDCVKQYTNRCFTEAKRVEFNKAVETPVNSIHRLCSMPDYRVDYMKHASCMKMTLTQDDYCGRHYKLLVSQVSGEAPTTSICCSHHLFRECVLDQTRNSCEADAEVFSAQVLDKALSFLKNQCAHYVPNQIECPGSEFYRTATSRSDTGTTVTSQHMMINLQQPPGKPHQQGQYPQGQGQYTQGQRPGGQYSEGKRPGGQYSQGERPGGQYSQGQRPGGQYSQGQRPQNDLPDRPTTDNSPPQSTNQNHWQQPSAPSRGSSAWTKQDWVTSWMPDSGKTTEATGEATHNLGTVSAPPTNQRTTFGRMDWDNKEGLSTDKNIQQNTDNKLTLNNTSNATTTTTKSPNWRPYTPHNIWYPSSKETNAIDEPNQQGLGSRVPDNSVSSPLPPLFNIFLTLIFIFIAR